MVKSYILRAHKQTLMPFLAGISADLAVYAHVHHQLMRYTTAEQIVLNPGSVGEPFCDWKSSKRILEHSMLC